MRIPQKSAELLNRIIEGELQYLRARRLPTQGVHKSAAFRTIWELGEMEYVLQRATLWVTRRTNRYSVEGAAEILGWRADALRALLEERGVHLPSNPRPPPEGQAPGNANAP